MTGPAGNPVVDRGASYFGPGGAVTVGVCAAVGFASRGEQPLVSILGALVGFSLGAGWILLSGRVRQWLLYRSGWPPHLQTLAFVACLFGPILIGAAIIQRFAAG